MNGGGEGMCGFRQGGVRTAGRHETMNGEGWGMCGFRQTRSDRKPQWDQGWGGVGDVRISPEAFGPQAAVGQSKGGKGMCGFRQRRSDRRPQWNHGDV